MEIINRLTELFKANDDKFIEEYLNAYRSNFGIIDFTDNEYHKNIIELSNKKLLPDETFKCVECKTISKYNYFTSQNFHLCVDCIIKNIRKYRHSKKVYAINVIFENNFNGSVPINKIYIQIKNGIYLLGNTVKNYEFKINTNPNQFPLTLIIKDKFMFGTVPITGSIIADLEGAYCCKSILQLKQCKSLNDINPLYPSGFSAWTTNNRIKNKVYVHDYCMNCTNSTFEQD